MAATYQLCMTSDGFEITECTAHDRAPLIEMLSSSPQCWGAVWRIEPGGTDQCVAFRPQRLANRTSRQVLNPVLATD